MEQEASSPNKEIADESYEEDRVVAIFQTTSDPLGSQVHE
jgi:hypothetical protein